MAKRAVCNCEQPDTCLCMVTVETGGKTFTYEQRGRLPNMNVHDKDSEGVKVDVLITPKDCVSGQDDCPSGFIHRIDKKEVEYRLAHSEKEECLLKYLDPVTTQTQISSKYNIVAIIGLVMKDMFSGIDYTRYRLVVDECKDQERRESEFYFQRLYFLTGIPCTVNYINVYPKNSIKLGIVIGTETAVAKLDADARRGIMRQYNRDFKKRDDHGGWTKRTAGQSITRSLTISGFSKYQWGRLKVNAETDDLKKEFIEYKNNLNFLNKAEEVFSTVENLFSVSGQKNPYPIVDPSILLPTIIAAGTYELKINEKTNHPEMRGKVDISLEPLIGVEFKVDLIQGFAAAYGLHYIVGAARDIAASGKEAVEKGEDGVYLEGKFDLVVEGAIDVGVSFFYDDDSKFDFKLMDNIEGKLTIGGKARIKAGGKVLSVSSYFAAGGSIIAEGRCGLNKTKAINVNDSDGLELIFYHKGIEAKFWADAGFGRIPEEKSKTVETDNKGVVTGQSTTSVEPNEDKLMEYTWQIAKPLDKDKSTYRVSII